MNYSELGFRRLDESLHVSLNGGFILTFNQEAEFCFGPGVADEHSTIFAEIFARSSNRPRQVR